MNKDEITFLNRSNKIEVRVNCDKLKQFLENNKFEEWNSVLDKLSSEFNYDRNKIQLYGDGANTLVKIEGIVDIELVCNYETYLKCE